MRTFKDVQKLFNLILKETAKHFDTKPNQVTSSQFKLVANGRLGEHSIAKFGGFTFLKQLTAPGKKNTQKTNGTLSAINKLVKYVQKSA